VRLFDYWERSGKVVVVESGDRKEEGSMAELVVIGYPDEATAEAAQATLGKLERELVVDLAGSAVVVADATGKVKMTTPTHATGAGAASGALWGMLFGLLFLIPIGGMIIGGLMGALFGKMSDTGIKDEFVAQVRDLLKPNTAALVVMYRKATPDKTLAALAPFGGTVLKSSLSADTEAAINEALSGGGGTAATAGTPSTPTA
jgi:uncharacterized membrane protein